MKLDLNAVKDAVVKRWPTRLGRLRTSTVVLCVVFLALTWVQQAYRPEPAATDQPSQQVVPPGFMPDPEWTWVPRTQVRVPETPTETTTTTTSPTETTTTSPEETTSPTGPADTATSPTSTPPEPRTTVVDPDGPGLLPPITLPVFPGATPTPATPQPQPGQAPAAPAPPR